jgi:hypothetical protein
MQKVNWLIEKDICDRNDEFLAELAKQGYFYKEVIIEAGAKAAGEDYEAVNI